MQLKTEKKTQEKKTYFLLVEDNTLIRTIYVTLFAKLACQIDIATDGLTALEKTKQRCYDLILMDIGLPDITGCEVAQQIRHMKKNPNRTIPIIGMTAHLNEENKPLCIESGMDIILTKPIATNVLEMIAKIIARSKNSVNDANDLSEIASFKSG